MDISAERRGDWRLAVTQMRHECTIRWGVCASRPVRDWPSGQLCTAPRARRLAALTVGVTTSSRRLAAVAGRAEWCSNCTSANGVTGPSRSLVNHAPLSANQMRSNSPTSKTPNVPVSARLALAQCTDQAAADAAGRRSRRAPVQRSGRRPIRCRSWPLHRARCRGTG